MPLKYPHKKEKRKQGGVTAKGGGKTGGKNPRPYIKTAQGGDKPRPYIKLFLLLCLLMVPLLACDAAPSVSVSMNGTPIISSSNGASNGSKLNVWNKVSTGVELRYEDWKNPYGDED